jgi:hypothetical protein
VTLLSYAVLPRAEIAGLRQPSMATVLEAVVGHWGLVFISLGLIVSVLGAYLAWQMIAAEVLFNAAKTDDMPRIFATENQNKVPAAALWLSNGIVQLFVISTLFSEDAFTLALKLCSSMSLIPYLLVAGYGLLIAQRGETYGTRPLERNRDLKIAAIVHGVFDFRRRHEVSAAVGGHLRARHRALFLGEAGAEQAGLHAGRMGHLCRCGDRRRHRHSRARDRLHHHLNVRLNPLQSEVRSYRHPRERACEEIEMQTASTVVRPSRRPLCGLLRMRYAFDGIKKTPHPEEAAKQLSRRTHCANPADLQFFHTLFRGNDDLLRIPDSSLAKC